MQGLSLLLRALTYATLFVGTLLVLVPRLLLPTAPAEPASFGAGHLIGVGLVLLGALLALWCVLSFAIVGRGTPAPFDAPRRLVTRGPYRYVRNPMYVGAVLVLLGAALFYMSPAIAAYALLFGGACQLMVVRQEEPVLGRRFGEDYVAYCRSTGRWLPRLGPRASHPPS